MAVNRYCDYCGEILLLGNRYYIHKSFCICDDCKYKYAKMMFENEAEIRTVENEELLSICTNE